MAMVCFASSPPTPHPLTQSTLTGLSHSFTHLKSSPHIKSGLVCVCHSLLCPISPHHLIHPPNPPRQVSAIPSLTSNPHLGSRVDWFVCATVCFVPSPPTISSTHPIHPNRSQPFLHLHQSLLWLSLSQSSPDTLFANPPSQSLHSALAHRIYRLFHRWFGCSLNVSCQ